MSLFFVKSPLFTSQVKKCQFQLMSSEPRTIVYHSLFDFGDFFENQMISDCKIVTEDQTEIPAHRVILANSSKTFFNYFTADMEESRTGIVKASFNPNGLLRKVVKYMYDGVIQIDLDNWVDLYAISDK